MMMKAASSFERFLSAYCVALQPKITQFNLLVCVQFCLKFLCNGCFRQLRKTYSIKTRRAMFCNIQASSHNHCCREKAISIIYFCCVCLCVSFFFFFLQGSRQLMPRMYCSHVAYCTTLNVQTLTTSRLPRDPGSQRWS